MAADAEGEVRECHSFATNHRITKDNLSNLLLIFNDLKALADNSPFGAQVSQFGNISSPDSFSPPWDSFPFHENGQFRPVWKKADC